MSVYTAVSDNDFATLVESYALGKFIAAEGIKDGIENTNYFIQTSKGEFVFTLFESLDTKALSLYIRLLETLSQNHFPCPAPCANPQGEIIGEYHSRPFIFATRLNGKPPQQVNHSHIRAIATALAQLHSTRFSFSATQQAQLQNRRGNTWREEVAQKIRPMLDNRQAELLEAELKLYRQLDTTTLPCGIIHADLFQDNALFQGDTLCGVIDFYDACYAPYIYDIAITLNAWCSNKEGVLDRTYEKTFLEAYQSVRPLSSAEQTALPIMLRMAATRFWLSRLEALQDRRPGEITQVKDPAEYQAILKAHIQQQTAEQKMICY